jgi:hypothetical protein
MQRQAVVLVALCCLVAGARAADDVLPKSNRTVPKNVTVEKLTTQLSSSSKGIGA